MGLQYSTRTSQRPLSRPDCTPLSQKHIPARRGISPPRLQHPEARKETESTGSSATGSLDGERSVLVNAAGNVSTISEGTESHNDPDGPDSSSDDNADVSGQSMDPMETGSQGGRMTCATEASEGIALQESFGDRDHYFTTQSLNSTQTSPVSRDRQSECGTSAVDRGAITSQSQRAATSPSHEAMPREQNDELACFGLDDASAQNILELLQKSADSLGLLTVLKELHFDPAFLVACSRNDISASPQCPPELCNVLLAVGIELQSDSLRRQVLENKNIIIDCLRVEFLKQTPNLAWKSPAIKVGHCIGFLLASYVWCLDPQVFGIASRWNDLARVLLDDLQSSHVADTTTKLLQQYVLKTASSHAHN